MRTGIIKEDKARVVHQVILSFKDGTLGIILEQEGRFYFQEKKVKNKSWAYGPFNSIWEAENNFKFFFKKD